MNVIVSYLAYIHYSQMLLYHYHEPDSNFFLWMHSDSGTRAANNKISTVMDRITAKGRILPSFSPKHTKLILLNYVGSLSNHT